MLRLGRHGDHPTGRLWNALALAGALTVMLALVACGSTGAAAGNTSSTATATSKAGGSIPGGGMAIRPCPGATGDATQVGALALVLTSGATSGTLHVGEMAQVRLPSSLHWTLNGQPDHLQGVGSAGAQDSALNVCYWTFRADSAGSVTLHFSGIPPCEGPSSGCSTAITKQDFTITVS